MTEEQVPEQANEGLTCEKCGATGMRHAAIPRFGLLLQVLGWCLVAGSLVVAVSVQTDLLTMERVEGEGELFWLWMWAPALLSAPWPVIGLLFALPRRVWLCSRCGYWFERAKV